MMAFIAASVSEQGLMSHNIEGFNDLIERGINNIMTYLFDVQRVFANQREEDRTGTRLAIPVPPKYTSAAFLNFPDRSLPADMEG